MQLAPDVSDEAFAKLLRVLRMMQSHMQQLEEAQGLSGAQLQALWQLSVHSQLSVSDLAVALHLQRSSTSNLLDKLEGRGFVVRTRNERDQRVVIVSLTPSGVDVVRRVPGPMGGRMRQAIKQLPPATTQQLFQGISALLDALQQNAPTGGAQTPPA